MAIVIGILLIAAGVLMFTGTLVLSRSEHPPPWLSDNLVANVLGPCIIFFLALGIGIFVQGVANFRNAGFGLPELGLALAILIASAAAWRRMRVRAVLAAYAAREDESAIAALSIVPLEPPPPPPPPADGKRAA